jgi:hypothetical protein
MPLRGAMVAAILRLALSHTPQVLRAASVRPRMKRESSRRVRAKLELYPQL